MIIGKTTSIADSTLAYEIAPSTARIRMRFAQASRAPFGGCLSYIDQEFALEEQARMAISDQQIEFVLQINADAADRQPDLEMAGAQLLQELRELPEVHSVGPVNAHKPESGTKSIDPTVAGALAVALITVGIPALIGFIKDWMMRNEGKTITIKVPNGGEVTFPHNIAPSELEAWIDITQKAFAAKPKK